MFRQRYSGLIQLNSIKPYSCFVLSIQYVYELRLLYLFAYLSKRVQKYNFYFNLQNFFEKIFNLFSQ